VVIAELESIKDQGPYDLVILSHVVEHLLDFDLLSLVSELLTQNGLLYVEVPNSLKYEQYARREFLYYFDRVHVNHFTPQSLARLAEMYGFGQIMHFEYAFPYRDGGEYPGLGMLFRKGSEKEVEKISPSILAASERYISSEKLRAGLVAEQFNEHEGVLIWGAGDNFYRSIENGGPLSGLRNFVVLDRSPREIVIGNRSFTPELPEEAIRRIPWPVIVTVSVDRNSIKEQIAGIDPLRPVFFV
jgi:hypothetical protein